MTVAVEEMRHVKREAVKRERDADQVPEDIFSQTPIKQEEDEDMVMDDGQMNWIDEVDVV